MIPILLRTLHAAQTPKSQCFFNRPDNPKIFRSRPHLIHIIHWAYESPTQTASWSVHPFLHHTRYISVWHWHIP